MLSLIQERVVIFHKVYVSCTLTPTETIRALLEAYKSGSLLIVESEQKLLLSFSAENAEHEHFRAVLLLRSLHAVKKYKPILQWRSISGLFCGFQSFYEGPGLSEEIVVTFNK